MNMLKESETSLDSLGGQRVAVLGYGNQGRAQALNLRDSGVDVVVGNRDDEYGELAIHEGWEPLPLAEAAAAGDIILVLTTDESQPLIWEEQIAPGIQAGNTLCWGSGYNVGYQVLEPTETANIIMIAPIMGPVVGGITIDWLSWRHVFFIPLPVAFVATLMSALFMPTRDLKVKRPPLDWQGYILVGLAIVCLMTAIANGQRDGWVSDKIVGLLVIGAGLATAFVISQYRSSAPILNFAVFKHPQFVIAATLGFVFGAGNFGSTYIIPVFVQTVQDFTPTAAGMVTVPAGIVVMCLYPVMGRLVDNFPIRYLAMTGLSIFAFGMILFKTTDVNTTFWTLAFFGIIGRLGFSIMIPAINVSALNALPPEQLDQGAGTINFVRLLGGAFGVNSLVVFMEQRTEFHSIALTATQTSHNSASRELLDQVADILQQSGVAEAFHQSGSLHFLGKVIEAQANTLGFKDGFMILSVIFILALVPAWRMGASKPR